jgi:hypothetical protein
MKMNIIGVTLGIEITDDGRENGREIRDDNRLNQNGCRLKRCVSMPFDLNAMEDDKGILSSMSQLRPIAMPEAGETLLLS